MATIDPVFLNDWHPIGRVSGGDASLTQALQDGKVLPFRLLGEDLVLWRSGNQIHVWQDFCPHRGARLSLGWVEGDTLVCPYHGFQYNSEGRCVRIPAHPDQTPPARACIRTYPTQERYGLIWTCLGKPTQDLPPFPIWDDPTYRGFLGGPYHYRSSPLRALENFIDVSHFPFVHGGMLGAPSHPAINDYPVELHPDGISFGEVHLLQHDLENPQQKASFSFNYRVFRPLTAYLSRGSGERRLSVFFTLTPVEEEECIGWMWLFMNHGQEVSEAEFHAFRDTIVGQDIPIVESQRPRRLPLDLQAEFHLPSDRASIAYRKWLKQLGVTFGTK